MHTCADGSTNNNKIKAAIAIATDTPHAKSPTMQSTLVCLTLFNQKSLGHGVWGPAGEDLQIDILTYGLNRCRGHSVKVFHSKGYMNNTLN